MSPGPRATERIFARDGTLIAGVGALVSEQVAKDHPDQVEASPSPPLPKATRAKTQRRAKGEDRSAKGEDRSA